MIKVSKKAPLRDRLMLPENWSDALAALQGHKQEGIRWRYTGKHDAKPLAELLKGTEPIPEYVRDVLGRLLAPPRGYQGGKLKYIKPSKRAVDLERRHRREIDAKRYIYELMHVNEPHTKFDTAIELAAKKFRMSQSWAKNLKALSLEKLLLKLSTSLDEGTLLP